MVKFTDTARDTILTFMGDGYMERPALRLVMRSGSPLAPDYELALIEEDEADGGDVLVETDGIRVYLDGENAEKLEDVTIDYVERGGETGFDIRNPGLKPLGAEPPTGPLAERVAKVIEERVNPGVASHGGKITLVDVRDDIAFITMSGGCQGCGLAAVTLRQGVERMIKEAVPEIVGVQDVTEHQKGENPYF